jgi:hypothetical protein
MNRLMQVWHEITQKVRPKTRIKSGGTKQSFFTQRQRNAELLSKYETIYNQGGIVSEALDSYAMFCLSKGWRLEGDEAQVAKVEAFIDNIDFDAVLWQMITDCNVYGDAFAEKVYTRDGRLVDLVPRLASSFTIIHDEYGVITGYEQNITDEFGQEFKVSLSPNQICHLQFNRLGGSVYGNSLIARAYDDIIRDTKVAESSAIAIQRHGYKKYHIRVGTEGEDVPQEVIDRVDREFQQLETKNDFVTTHDVEIMNVDQGGLEHIDTYSDVFIMRLCVSLGVPEELMGLRRGSTDATATKRIDVFFRKISTIQQKIARCFELSIFDEIIGSHGAVELIFNDVSPSDEAEKAAWISELVKATPLDPFIILPRQWIQEQFDIDDDAYEDEDDFMIPEVPDETDKPGDSEGTDTDENPAETV